MNPEPARNPDPEPRAVADPALREPPGDGYPRDEDVSNPPPESDIRTGQHKKEDE